MQQIKTIQNNKKEMKPIKLSHLGSLILVNESDGENNCLGYLMKFGEHGVFDATYGRVDVTTDQAKIHNKLFEQAELEGLDNCKIGKYGSFYYDGSTRRVNTLLGTMVSETTSIRGSTITFHRTGKTFRGKIGKDSEMFSFKRIE